MTCCYGLASVVVRGLSSVNIFFSRTIEPILTKFGMYHPKGKETRNCKFHDLTQRRGNFVIKIVKLMYFLKNLLLYPGACFRRNKCIVMMTNEGYTNIVNFMTPRGKGSCARVWPHKSYSENALFL